ncbi:MAG: hypothetical protein LJE68_08195 [Rhodobacter sp.]|nr:hypothetical protein [Rhodobacter sp.]
MTLDEIDKTGLIREAYRIEGITAPECRSIFVDWAIKLPVGIEASDAIRDLLRFYAGDAPDHPMTEVLRAGQAAPKAAKRRGGRAGRMAR